MAAHSDYNTLLRTLLGSQLYEYKSDDNLHNQVRAQLISRDKDYSELLHSYVKISQVRNVLKEVHKWLLFWLMIAACFVGYRLLARIISPILASEDSSVVVAAMPVLIAALVSFVASVIAVPLAVVNFLFNSGEDDNITDIIKHTQEHDAAGRTWVKPLKQGTKDDKESKDPNNG